MGTLPLTVCCVGFVVVVSMILAIRREKEFAEKFPPISDAEFLARCTPGTSPEVALKVRRTVAKNLGVQYEQVYPSTRFVEDLGAG